MPRLPAMFTSRAARCLLSCAVLQLGPQAPGSSSFLPSTPRHRCGVLASDGASRGQRARERARENFARTSRPGPHAAAEKKELEVQQELDAAHAEVQTLRQEIVSNDALIGAAFRAAGVSGGDATKREVDERIARLHAMVDTAEAQLGTKVREIAGLKMVGAVEAQDDILAATEPTAENAASGPFRAAEAQEAESGRRLVEH